MIIGCPKEIKAQEGRVGLTPAGVDALVRAGHTVYIEKDAGLCSGFTDEEYKVFLDTVSRRSYHDFNVALDSSKTTLTVCTCSRNDKYRTVLHALKKD